MSKTIRIINGLVFDGLGSGGRRSDLLLRDDTIVALGRPIPGTADLTLDADGKAVAPGFIDTHSHASGGILDHRHAETQVRQGITTAIVGQDGSSEFPLADWFARLERTPAAINFASFVGHGTVRDRVVGKDYRRPSTPDEIRRMCGLVEQEMKAGALGLSSGLEYDPGLFAGTDEVIALAKIAARFRGLYISHVRDEENEALASFKELIRVAEEGRLPAQISHIKLASSPVWGKAKEVFRLMDEARRRGVDITADVYPYTYWQSSIIVLIPTREWDRRDLWETGLAEIGGAKNVLLSRYEPDARWQGKTLADIATMTGKDPVSVIQEIVKRTRSEPRAGESVVVTAMQEKDLKAFLTHPRIMFCTDGGLRGSHPRGAGSYPRILGKYVREERVLPLKEAIRKATSLPAWRMGLKDRGTIAVGKKADLVLFDPRTIHDTATTNDPQSVPVGLTDVLVNGVPVLRDGQPTGEYPGRVLRRSA
ncbi:MAG: D-aminoacylase [Capsulimonadales bacterium]|nr:D-aminoacylase [Capsulimonadales bacterium]